ncbi:hypothetical protein BGZ49_000167 [Haplosporangium sp. Z 27]|nr:hypothetical protein BGZ49_000167 [Haplosporangium sp. Z 27]
MLLKQQWRPGVLALWLIIMDMVYWLFYFMDIKGLQSLDPNSQGFLDWIGCLAHQTKTAVNLGQISLQAPTADQVNALGRASQQACAYVAAPWVPNFVWGAVADLLPAIFGTVLLIIFGSRVQLWRDLRVRLFGKPSNIGNQDRGSKNPKTSTEKSLPPPPRPRHDTPPNYLESFFESQIEDLYSSPRNLSLVTSGDSAESGPTRFSQLIAWDRSPGAALAYRADTPEAWKPSPVPSSFALCLTASENDIANLTRINGTSTPQPNITSLRVPPQSQKRFYNTEDFEALPIFLVTPPPMYNPNNNRSQHHLATPTKDNDDCPEGDVHKAVVSEASRIQLNYRTNSGSPYQQPQVVHQTKPQRTESLPAPARPRNPARKESLHKSSPAPARTLNLARHDDSSTDPSNFSRNESLSRTNSPNYNQNLIRADSLGLNLSIPKRPTKNSARFK